jgi:hypothetical protein
MTWHIFREWSSRATRSGRYELKIGKVEDCYEVALRRTDFMDVVVD